MLHGVMLGPVMFSCLFGGARHGLYTTLSKVSHKTANGTIHYPSCHLFYPVLNPFSFSYGYFAVMFGFRSEKKKLCREALVYILVFEGGGGVNGLFTSRTVWGDLHVKIVGMIVSYLQISTNQLLRKSRFGWIRASNGQFTLCPFQDATKWIIYLYIDHST